jgi:hypothetical protein
MDKALLLYPVLGMGFLTIIMLFWMAALRLPAMRKAGMSAEDGKSTKLLGQRLPPHVQQVADNYNHLFEQPTVFYALVFYIYVLGHSDDIHIGCAWAFFILRVAHSLVQATSNYVPARFACFALAWLSLLIMMVRELLKIMA